MTSKAGRERTSIGLFAPRAPEDPRDDDDAMSVPLQSEGHHGFLVVVTIAIAASIAFTYERGGETAALLNAAPLLLMLPIFLYRGGCVVDRRARTMTVWRWLIVCWSRTIPLEGKTLQLVEYYRTPKRGPGYWMANVWLGEHMLLVRRSELASQLAQRISDFADVPRVPKRVESAGEMWLRWGRGYAGGLLLLACWIGTWWIFGRPV